MVGRIIDKITGRDKLKWRIDQLKVAYEILEIQLKEAQTKKEANNGPPLTHSGKV